MIRKLLLVFLCILLAGCLPRFYLYLEPATELSAVELENAARVIKERLSIEGYAPEVDIDGSRLMVTVNKQGDIDILVKKNLFTASIGDTIIFSGGDDIEFVCKTAGCSGISSSDCRGFENGWKCSYGILVRLNEESASRFASATKDLQIMEEEVEPYLSEKLVMRFNDKVIDELFISAYLRGNEQTELTISGIVSGETKEEVMEEALEEMKALQASLITGPLPVDFIVEKN